MRLWGLGYGSFSVLPRSKPELRAGELAGSDGRGPIPEHFNSSLNAEPREKACIPGDDMRVRSQRGHTTRWLFESREEPVRRL